MPPTSARTPPISSSKVPRSLGLFGLVLAGGAIDVGMYHFGLALFAFAFLFDLWLIKTHFDRLDAS
jgi:hypothetical protein